LANCPYVQFGSQGHTDSEVIFEAEVDRVYSNIPTSALKIQDTNIEIIKSSSFKDVVVWNPVFCL
jgi:D-hexose-6-phosphate mutarotase